MLTILILAIGDKGILIDWRLSGPSACEGVRVKLC